MHRGRIVVTVALLALLGALAACTTSGTTRTSGRADVAHRTTTPAPSTPAPSSSQRAHRHHRDRPRTQLPSRSPSRRTRTPRPHTLAPRPAPPTAARRPARPSGSARPVRHSGTALPLDDPTGHATQVLTVVAGAESDTRGTLQAWRRVHGGWRRVGPALRAWVGTAGMTTQPRETLSATPIGSWTLTRAFGRSADPGTRLPYTQTTPEDWWISQPGPLYNTFQRCASGCGFTQGSPNEHLYYVAPEYDYAVVIDYNTRNAGPVHQGAGSAFFLHVSGGEPTAGCVAIGESALVRIMRWLDPADHPRILIGTR